MGKLTKFLILFSAILGATLPQAAEARRRHVSDSLISKGVDAGFEAHEVSSHVDWVITEYIRQEILIKAGACYTSGYDKARIETEENPRSVCPAAFKGQTWKSFVNGVCRENSCVEHFSTNDYSSGRCSTTCNSLGLTRCDTIDNLCGPSTNACVIQWTNMISEPIDFVANAVVTIVTAGSGTLALNSTKALLKNTAKQAADQARKQGSRAARRSFREALQTQHRKILHEMRKKVGAQAIAKQFRDDYLEALMEEASEELLIAAATREEPDFGSAVEWLDPTGIASVVNTFAKPRCQPMPILYGEEWSGWFSEEEQAGSRAYECAEGFAVSGLACRGEDCDFLNVKCSPVGLEGERTKITTFDDACQGSRLQIKPGERPNPFEREAQYKKCRAANPEKKSCSIDEAVVGVECLTGHCSAIDVTCQKLADTRPHSAKFKIGEGSSRWRFEGIGAQVIRNISSSSGARILEVASTEEVGNVYTGEWSEWFSEEDPGGLCEVDAAVIGWKCQDSYCDKQSVKCGDAKLIGARDKGRVAISEEKGRNFYVNNQFNSESGDSILNYVRPEDVLSSVASAFGKALPQKSTRQPSTVIVGAECRGDYCDNLTFTTQTYDGELTNCRAVGPLSEEDGGEVVLKADEFLSGVQCYGDYCDRKVLLACTGQPRDSTPPPPVTPPTPSTQTTLKPPPGRYYIQLAGPGCPALLPYCDWFLAWDRGTSTKSPAMVEKSDRVIWELRHERNGQYRIFSTWGNADDPMHMAELSFDYANAKRGNVTIETNDPGLWTLTPHGDTGIYTIKSVWGCPGQANTSPLCGGALAMDPSTRRATISTTLGAYWRLTPAN